MRRGPQPTYVSEDERATAHRMSCASAMKRYRARLKEKKRLAEAVATAAAASPGSVAAEADECMFCVGTDDDPGFLVYSQGGIVRQVQPVSEASTSI